MVRIWYCMSHISSPRPPKNIFVASAHGDKAGVIDCLRAGQNIHGEDEEKQTPFFLACVYNRVKIVEWLLKTFHVRLNHVNNTGYTPLQGAVHRGHVEIVRILLMQDGVNINCQNLSGKTPLYSAIVFRRVEIVQMLLNAGVDMTIESNEGNNVMALVQNRLLSFMYPMLKRAMPKEPIVNAVRNFRDIETFQQEIQDLLEAGTNINIEELNGNTALREALVTGVVDAVRVLLTTPGVETIYSLKSVNTFDLPEKTFELLSECAISGDSPIPSPLRCLTDEGGCGHAFDANSGIIEWLTERGQCPLCRKKVEYIQIMSKEDVGHWNDMEIEMQSAIKLEKQIRASQDYKNASDDHKKELLKASQENIAKNEFKNRLYAPTRLKF